MGRKREEERERERNEKRKRKREEDNKVQNLGSQYSNNGHSEEWTVSLQWTHCSPPAYIHYYLQGRDNLRTMDKTLCPQLFRGSTVVLCVKQGEPIPRGLTQACNASETEKLHLATVTDMHGPLLPVSLVMNTGLPGTQIHCFLERKRQTYLTSQGLPPPRREALN